jgi:antitoxin YefM
MLSSETTYTQARANLASLLDRVVDDKQVIVIKRRNNRNVALIAEEELSSLLETMYLLRSPKNATRLLTALERSKTGTTQPMTIDELCEELEIVKQEQAQQEAG